MKFLDLFLNWIFPTRCLGCGIADVLLCSSCLSSIPLHSLQVCPVCRKVSGWGRVCTSCFTEAQSFWALDGLFVVAQYTQASLLQTCVKTFKYRHGAQLLQILGSWAGQTLKQNANAFSYFQDFSMISVPLYFQRERERGYNQAALLGQSLTRTLHFSYFEPLIRHQATLSQAQLSREARLKNVSNCFSLKPKLQLLNKKFILIDDVCTTGATLNACARVLKDHGAEEVWGFVLGRG